MTHCGSPGMCGKRPDCLDTNCPGRTEALETRRIQEDDYRWSKDIGYEAAIPPAFTDPDPEPRLSADAKVLIVAVCLFWLAILALSIADPRDLSTIWPRLVALASF